MPVATKLETLPEVHPCPYCEIEQVEAVKRNHFLTREIETECRERKWSAEKARAAHLRESLDHEREAFEHLFTDLQKHLEGDGYGFSYPESDAQVAEYYRKFVELEKIRELHAVMEAKIKSRFPEQS